MQDLGARLEEVVGRLLAEQRARYSLVVDSTAWTLVDGAVRVEGAVLVASQATAYQQAIAAALPDLATADVPRPTVLTELDTPFDAVRWASVRGDDAVDLHSGPEGADLQTQWTPPAAVRLFSSRGARALVQLPDGTVGWVDADRLVPAAPEEDPWRDLRRAPAGAVTEADGPLSAAARLARERLGRPYLWGGNTEAAADCSGFVQSVLQRGARVLLPKNTRDQMQRGVRVARDGIAPGDLVFVRGREQNIMHVGLALPGEGGITVVHSCLSRGRVLEEPLPVFLDRYRFTAARRVVAWGAE